MSRAFHPSSLLVITFIALVGCSDSGSVVAPAEIRDQQSAAVKPAFASGAVIEDLELFTFLANDALGLAVGIEDLAAACANSEVSLSPQRGQVVVTPSGKNQLHVKTREAFVEVWDVSQLGELTDFPCQLLEGPLVASGTVTFSQVVHEVPNGAPGTFSIHATIVGVVDLTSGGQGRLHAILQAVLRPDGSIVQERIEIDIKPI